MNKKKKQETKSRATYPDLYDLMGSKDEMGGDRMG